jgi:hypothetical protein
MEFRPALSDKARQQVLRLGEADILVAIPSHNNQNTIAKVIQQAGEGLATYFDRHRTVLLVCDGGSLDDTREVALQTDIPLTVQKAVITYWGTPGKGTAFRAVFQAAKDLNVSTLVTLDADLRSITPEWVHNLAAPILSGEYDYVTPHYSRYKYDGTITNLLIYPLTVALYGKRLRQPIGGDFGLSRHLLDFLEHHHVWCKHVAQFGIDIWLTTSALAEGFRVAQARLGAKVHDAKDPAFSLGPMYMQVLTTLFEGMGHYADRWKKITTFEDVPIIGDAMPWEPEPIPITLGRLIDEFKMGYEHFGVLWENLFTPEVYKGLAKIASLENHNFEFPPDLWAKTIYEIAAIINSWRGNVHKLVDLTAPFYYGRIASLALRTREMSNAQAEEVVLEDARAFETLKPYLLEQWQQKVDQDQ